MRSTGLGARFDLEQKKFDRERYRQTADAIDADAVRFVYSHYGLRDGRTIRMLRDECLLRLIAPERRTASKILWIPDSAKRQEYEMYNGEVLACGPGAIRRKDGRRNPIEVKPGDKVMFYWLAGETRAGTQLFDVDGSELRIVAESFIMGKWTD